MTFNELVKLVSSTKSPAISIDSRRVKEGDIFVAIKGTFFDGHDFIDHALANGAKYIVSQKPHTRYEIRDTKLSLLMTPPRRLPC